MLPTTQEYKISIMIGEDSFRTLKDIEIISNPNYPNEPWYSTGGLAIVFKIKMKEKFYALKCFYVETNERQERLEHIATYLKQNPSPYFVDFTYLDNELWVETAQGGNGYPVILMEWVEGKTLDNYLAEVCKIQDKARLQNLYFQFCNLAWWLQQQPIAHGDLKHDNLIVTTEGKLKLIDYDGMFVPALSSRKASELGSPCYQHPQRDTHFFNKDLDDFSLLILLITLLALKQDSSLFNAHYNGDGILLKDTDYPNFAKSSIKAHLWRLDDLKIPLLLSQLQSNLHKLSSIDLMPLLQDVEWINWLVGGQKDSILTVERRRLKELVLEELQGRFFFVTQIMRNYSFNQYLLTKYKNIWDWEYLSLKNSLPWSRELIEMYKGKLDWEYLSHNQGLLWTIDLIEGYKDIWDWENLSQNNSLPWSIELIDMYKDWWNWENLSQNGSLPWSIELIDMYKDWWNWENLSDNYSLLWKIELIYIYKDRWDWRNLSSNQSLPWTIELIDMYKDRWSWIGMSFNESLPWTIELIDMYKDRWSWIGMSCNESLPWTIELIDMYKDRWSWSDLSHNSSLPWTIDLIDMYKDRWDWRALSDNPSLPWTIDLIDMYKDRWDWRGVSRNVSLPWTIELIDMYKDRWSWRGMSFNKSLPWTIELIDMYKDKWDWSALSDNSSIPWTINLIEKNIDKWDWERLSKNEGSHWTIDLIEKFKDRWDWRFLERNTAIYEKLLSPLLDDFFIDEVMSSLPYNF